MASITNSDYEKMMSTDDDIYKDDYDDTELRCPITLDYFHDAVIASDGITYDKSSILIIIKGNKISPCTKQILTDHLITNYKIMDKINKFMKINPDICLEYNKIKTNVDEVSQFELLYAEKDKLGFIPYKYQIKSHKNFKLNAYNEKNESFMKEAFLRLNEDDLIHIMKNAIDVEVRDYSGWMPIHYTILHKKFKVFAYLIKIINENNAYIKGSNVFTGFHFTHLIFELLDEKNANNLFGMVKSKITVRTYDFREKFGIYYAIKNKLHKKGTKIYEQIIDYCCLLGTLENNSIDSIMYVSKHSGENILYALCEFCTNDYLEEFKGIISCIPKEMFKKITFKGDSWIMNLCRNKSMDTTLLSKMLNILSKYCTKEINQHNCHQDLFKHPIPIVKKKYTIF